MASPNPVQALMLQQLMQKIAGAAGPGAGPGGGAGGGIPLAGSSGSAGGGTPGGDAGATVASPADSQGDALSKELSVMRVADPQMVNRKLTEIKQSIITMLNHTAMSLPSVARSLSKTLVGIDGALKAAGEAATTMQTVGGGPDQSAGPVGPPLGSSALPQGFMGTSGPSAGAAS